MSHEYIWLLDETARLRYQDKLDVMDSECPWQIPADRWQDNAPDLWPPLNQFAINYYLVQKPGKFQCILKTRKMLFDFFIFLFKNANFGMFGCHV